MTSQTQNTITFSAAFLLVILVFHIAYGLEVLIPSNISWLLSVRHDWGQHYLGWAFYRNEPWSFPLGEIDSLCYPVGTNVGYWDSIPLLALIFKVFSPVLPQDFQYLGPWLLFCHLMVAYYVIRIFKLYNAGLFFTLIGVLFITYNPVLIFRGMHPSLCAHGFILASIYYYLKPVNKSNVYRINTIHAILVILTALISPYICLMVAGFTVLLPLKHWLYDKLIPFKAVLIYPVLTGASILLLWYVVGMLNFDSTNLEVSNSYGLYGFNLNSFFNSRGFSTLFPLLNYVTELQYEGYMYLGLGIMVLLVLSLLVLLTKYGPVIIKAKKQALMPLLVLAVLLALFAVTNRITFNQTILFEFPLPKVITKLGGVFRASGRFFWPGYYLLLLGALLILVKSRIPSALKLSVLAILVCVQAYDIKPILTFRNLKYGEYDTPLDEVKWSTALKNFDRMITYPPFNNHLLANMDYQDLCFVALKNGKAISTGYTARDNTTANKRYLDSLDRILSSGRLDKNELYITTAAHLDAFGVVLHNRQAHLNYLDGYYLVYSKDKILNLKTTPEVKKKVKAEYQQYLVSGITGTIQAPVPSGDRIQYTIDKLTVNEQAVHVQGWAFLKHQRNNERDSIFITLSSNGKTYLLRTKQMKRPDIAGAFNNGDLQNAGFSTTIFNSDVPSQNYTLGLLIKSAGKEGAFVSLGTIKEIEGVTKPVAIMNLPEQKNQMGGVDEINAEGDYITISGWTAFKDKPAKGTEIYVVLHEPESASYTLKTKSVSRPDVTKAYSNYNYDDSGYLVKFRKNDLPPGKYEVALLIKDLKTGAASAMFTNKSVVVE